MTAYFDILIIFHVNVQLIDLSSANSSETAAVQLQSSMAAITQFVQGMWIINYNVIWNLIFFRNFVVNLHKQPFQE